MHGDELRSRWNRKCWAFSPRVEPSCYFKPGGGYQPSASILSNRSTKGRPRVSRLCHARKAENSIILTVRKQ
mgnify:CR=1 FL=1